MSRRRFLALGTMALPFGVAAQPAGKRPLIGFIGSNSAEANRPLYDAFAKRLSALGWTARTVDIDRRDADGSVERAGEIAAEFVRLRTTLIVVTGDAQVLAAKRTTATIPIVFAGAGDPVGNGLVASLARPGGNVTGLSVALTETTGKRIELLREILPDLRRLAIGGNLGNPTVAAERGAAHDAARSHALEVTEVDFIRPDNIGLAIAPLRGRVDALYVCQDPMVNSHAAVIGAAGLAGGLPVVYGFRESAAAGGLMSYGSDRQALHVRAAELVDKVLRGTSPAEIPVELPTKFSLLINLRIAKALGLTIPPAVLARADEMIE